MLHTAAATDGKVPANEAFVRKILLCPGKGEFFIAGGQFSYRRFKYIAQSPSGLYKKITAEDIAGMLDNNIIAAQLIKCTNCTPAAKTTGEYRLKVSDAQFLWAEIAPAVKNPAHKFAVLLRCY